MGDVPRVIVATSGRRGPDGKRIDLEILSADGVVWTVLRIFDGIRCVGTRALAEGAEAEDAAEAARIFNETVRALTADGVDGLEAIPQLRGHEIVQAAFYVQRSGEQPHLDERFDLSPADWETLVRTTL
jgi:hypothetical protein